MKKEANTLRSWFNSFDFVFLIIVVVLVLFGLLMVYSSSFILSQERTGDGLAYIKKQLLFTVLGFGAMAAATRIHYSKWMNWSAGLLIAAMVLLVAVLIPGLGARVGGAQRWIRLGFMNFQPSEFVKFALIVFVARQLSKKQERLHQFTAGVLANFLLPLPALILLLKQPDFGSVVMIGVTIFAMMFLAGVSLRYLFGSLALAVAGAGMLIWLEPYRLARFMSFLDPWADPGGKGFQIIQSFVGLNHGGFFGVGLGNGKEKLFYLPEAHNDFILAVIGEELGYLGVIAVISGFLLFIYRGLKIALTSLEATGDRFAFNLGVGITLIIGLQAFVNIAVVLGLLPTKGLTLPFISYGGSAILVNLFAVGVLLSLTRKQTT
ncbi:MAG: putative lipid II flippase FtsW [Xanthomonadaceae bacterium]|nr:putative lipid II flippase FtsW [Xanthomonadaceae bacterium]